MCHIFCKFRAGSCPLDATVLLHAFSWLNKNKLLMLIVHSFQKGTLIGVVYHLLLHVFALVLNGCCTDTVKVWHKLKLTTRHKSVQFVISCILAQLMYQQEPCSFISVCFSVSST